MSACSSFRILRQIHCMNRYMRKRYMNEEERTNCQLILCCFLFFLPSFPSCINNTWCVMWSLHQPLKHAGKVLPSHSLSLSAHIQWLQNPCHRVFGRKQEPQKCTAAKRAVKYLNSAQRWRWRTEGKQLIQLWKLQEIGMKSCRKAGAHLL